MNIKKGDVPIYCKRGTQCKCDHAATDELHNAKGGGGKGAGSGNPPAKGDGAGGKPAGNGKGKGKSSTKPPW